jgi:peptidoglycan/xylan/chitin deacetylase (PgdA/CDA1 family)
MQITGNNGKHNQMHFHNIKVLMYHKIVKEDKISCMHWTYVSEKQFRKHLLFLDKWGFTPITFRDYLLFTKGRLSLPKKPVIITFDDGYEVAYKIAFPLVKEMGWNAVIFVIGDKKIKTNIWDNKFDTGNNTLLNADQIIKMHEAGFEIGSHSMTHLHLPSLSIEDALFEIVNSKEELEILTGAGVKSFCYPYGAVNEHIKQMVKEAGYSIGCGVYSGHPRFGHDIFDIRRITITNNTNKMQFALKMLTPFEYYEYISSKALHRKGNYSNTGIHPELSERTRINTGETYTNV